MSQPSDQRPQSLHHRLEQVAPEFPYPPLPDVEPLIAARLAEADSSSRPVIARWAWVMIAVGMMLAGLLAVPPVRAAVLEVLQLGAVHVFLTEPAPTATHPAVTTAPNVDPGSLPTPLASLLDLAGETTLAEAQTKLDFSIRLPSYPAELGPPDRVHLQEFGAPVVILVWLDPDQPGQVMLSLHQLSAGTFAQKMQPRVVAQTQVNGQPALWTTGPYLLQFGQGGDTTFDGRRLIDGHTLIWTEGEVTYRLESDLSLAEAVRIAESL